MDKYIPKELTGSLFKNDKGDNEKRPDYRGDASIEGVIYEMAAWIRESASGTKYMSISFKAKEQPQPVKAAPKKQERVYSDMDQEIPF